MLFFVKVYVLLVLITYLTTVLAEVELILNQPSLM